MEKIDLSSVTASQLEELLLKKKEEERTKALRDRETYEDVRKDVLRRIESRVLPHAAETRNLFEFIQNETTAFREIMLEYGQLSRGADQLSYTLSDEKFKIEVKSNKVKGFDERADVAAAKLIEFLRRWIQESNKGQNDPMYQLAMTLLERNRYGDLDYKSISKLYDLEDRFNNMEYSEIMALFKESNVVEKTAVNYYCYKCSDRGVWERIELSFNRM